MRLQSISTGLGVSLAPLLVTFSLLGGCGDDSAGTVASQSTSGDSAGAKKDRYVLGMVAKSQDNPVFRAAQSGAEAAARELGRENGVEVEIVWRSPASEDAARQSEIMAELIATDVDGIAISCTDGLAAATSINKAVAQGVPVVTFDSDAPDSSRMAYYGINDQAAGAMVMDRLAEAMEEDGRVAVLVGNRTADNMVNRTLGVRDASVAYAGIELIGVFHHDESPAGAAAAITAAHEEHGPIDGWALAGGWPMYTEGGLSGVPEGVPVVSIDLLPQTLDYLESGAVEALVGQPYYDWGYQSVSLLFDRLHEGSVPERPIITADLELVERDDASQFRQRWSQWVGEAPTPASD